MTTSALLPKRGCVSQAGLLPAVLAAVTATFLSSDAALACRGARNWPTGAELEKLKPGDIVVRAKLLEVYKAEKPIKSIMGHPFGMIYSVKVMEELGGPPEKAREIVGATILIRLKPSLCEAYHPGDFGPSGVKTLVLTKDESGLWDIIGGEGPKY